MEKDNTIAKAQIMIAEDEIIVAEDLKDILIGLGYKVSDIATSGEEAIQKVTEKLPDLVLMDIVLKGNTDGIKAAKQIRERFNIPVVYLTAYSDENTLLRAKITEPYGYILKPFEERELHTTIEMAIYKHKMEMSLRESKQWLSTTLKSIGDAVIATDDIGCIKFMNHIAEALTGWNEGEALGRDLKNILCIINEKTREVAQNYVTKVLQEGVVVRLENHSVLIAKGGKEIPVEYSAAPIKDDKGNTVGVVLIFHDITERKMMETALRESEEKYRTMIEYSNDIIWMLDKEGRFTFSNERAEEISGYKVEEWMNKSYAPLISSEDLPRIQQIYLDTISGKPQQYEIKVYRRDGSLFVLSVNTAPIFEAGKIIGTVSFGRDITEHKRAVEALRESEEKYRTFFEESKDIVYISTPEGKFTDINPAGVKLFGYSSKEELMKVDITNSIYYNAQDREIFQQVMAVQEFVKDFEIELKKKDGQKIIVLVTASVVRDEHGNITEYRGIMHDITKRKKLEEQLLHSQKMEAIGQLAGGIAHDFNNILTVLIGCGEILHEKIKEDALKDYVEEMLVSLGRATNLTRSLLTFSRKQVMELKPINLNEITRRMESFLLRLIGEDIELSTILIKEELNIMADSSQIEQVLMNLAANARYAMPDGGRLIISTKVTVLDNEFIKFHGFGKPGIFALITFSDTGMGMDDYTKERIFDPFFTTKEMGKGTGLGLAIVYGIIKQHGGYIICHSALGKGTTFNIYLPLINKPVKEMKLADLSVLKGGNETILIAEDDVQVRGIIKDVLIEFGYEVIEAIDGEDATRLFYENEDKIELLIFDVIMPKKNGKDVYIDLKKAKPDIKALFVSGYMADFVHKKGIVEDGLDIILKPISPRRLIKKVREVLD